ncbi:MAG: PAS domain-containing protein, partial [Patescibacteria group bacterium]
MSGQSVESEASTTYNRKVNTIMFWVARTTPLLVGGYAVFVLLGVVKPSQLFSWQALILVLVAITIVAFNQRNTFYQPLSQQFAFYIVALTTIVFVMGFELVVLTWGVLSVATYLNYGMKRYYQSYLILLLFALIDIALQWPLYGIYHMYFDVMVFAFTFWGTTILVKIVEAQTLDHERLIKTRRRESLQYSRMQALINGLSDAIISFDNKGVIKLYNSATLNLLDTNKSLTGQNIDDVVRLYNKGAGKKARASLFQLVSSENKQLETEDFMHRFDDGEEIRLNIVSAPIRNSYGKNSATKEGYISILRDITKVKSLEEERDEFISVISHELRTPITITEGTVSNMMVMA